MRRRFPVSSLVLVLLAFAVAAREGPPVPKLPPPGASTYKRPVVVGWPDGLSPKAPPGFEVTRFADGFDSGRWLYVLPNGDVLVAQARTERMDGFPPEVLEALARQGAFGPSANNILLLRRTTAGLERRLFLDGLHQPFGMLLLDGWFYVANTDSLWRYRYRRGATRLDGPGEKLLDLPAGEEANPWNNHWTRNLAASPDGRYIYITVGSATDANANGMEPPNRAAIWRMPAGGGPVEIFASGLRNPVGLAFEPATGALWATVNERDTLGEDLPPDYLTEVVAGGFYGWPWVYFGRYADPVQAFRDPAGVQRAQAIARVPDLPLGAHSVPLGLLFHPGKGFPPRYAGGAFVARRAGVGRSRFHGPDVLYLPFRNGRPTGEIEVFLSGFVADEDRAEVHGRAVGLALLPDGSLLVSDDGANLIWQVRWVGS
ncbi:MAG: sorbosone dehydrogenase family protein [Gammaproteobacteria bacterium]|nr:MAG: sorbosone dehydrogenase family protein [Gammaproteobacteria bacterium]